jgi:hypothetical protein
MSARDLTPEERRERGTKLCERLAEDVASIVPKGIGRWDRAWDIVGGPDADFVAELTAWEAEPGTAALERVRGSYRAVLAAWQRAADEYGAERRRQAR